MALSNPQYRRVRRNIYQYPAAKAELRALENLPSKSEFRAALDAIDARLVAQFPNFKRDIETAIGEPVSNTLAKLMIDALVNEKAG